MDENDPQVRIGLAIAHLHVSDEYQPDTVHCQRAQAEAQIAIAMFLSGIGAQLQDISNHLGTMLDDGLGTYERKLRL